MEAHRTWVLDLLSRKQQILQASHPTDDADFASGRDFPPKEVYPLNKVYCKESHF